MNYKILIVLALTACGSQGAIEETGVSRKAVVDDDENCGAEGYACVDGRTCIDSVCSPAWITMETMGAPDARGEARGGFIDDNYILMGGCDELSEVSALDSVVSYDLSNDTWGSYPSLEQGRAQFSSITSDDGIYVFGGLSTCFNGSSVGPGMEVNYGIDDDWSIVNATNTPSPRYNTSLAWTGDGLIVYGGSDPFTPYLNDGGFLPLGGPWKTIECPLTNGPTGGSFLSFSETHVFHIIGNDSSYGLLYDIENKNWYDWTIPSTTPDLSSIAGGGPSKYSDDGQRLYILGNDNSVYIYDRITREWINDASSQPIGLCGEAATAWSGSELIAWGGICDSSLSSVGGRYQPPAPITP